jgi:hypothetical protein
MIHVSSCVETNALSKNGGTLPKDNEAFLPKNEVFCHTNVEIRLN